MVIFHSYVSLPEGTYFSHPVMPSRIFFRKYSKHIKHIPQTIPTICSIQPYIQSFLSRLHRGSPLVKTTKSHHIFPSIPFSHELQECSPDYFKKYT